MFGKIKQALANLAQRPNLMAALRNLGWLVFDRVFRLGVSFVVTSPTAHREAETAKAHRG